MRLTLYKNNNELIKEIENVISYSVNNNLLKILLRYNRVLYFPINNFAYFCISE